MTFGSTLLLRARASRLPIAFVDAITQQFLLLSKHPYSGRRRDDLRLGLRSVTAGSYVVIYRIEKADVLILHVVHGRRDIKEIVRH